MAFPQGIESPARVGARPLTPGERAEQQYPSGGPPRPDSSVHGYVARQAVSVIDRHLYARGRERFGVDREVNLYLRPERVAVPDVLLYLRRPASKPAGAGAYVVSRDKAPELVLEILSAFTWQSDVPHADDEETVARKIAFYEACGVKEYWIYDPEACRPAPAARLEGFRLRDGVYAALAPDLDGRWFSAVLDAAWGLAPSAFLQKDRYLPLRLQDPRTGAWYPTIEEHDRQFRERKRQLDERRRQLNQQLDAQGQRKRQLDQQLDAQGQQIDELKAVLARYRERFGPLQ